MAELEGPIIAGTVSRPADPRPVRLDRIGYVEEEWFVHGDAASYEPVGDHGPDGRWDVATAATAPYRTRFLVRRPSEAERFSGIVVVEWLNVTSVEAAPDWAYLDRALVDAGAAWMGVSVQALGVVGGSALLPAGVGNEGVRATHPERYSTLEHPGDAFAFDIYSQVGASLRSPAGAAVVGGLEISHVIAAGESQSAGFLTTYLNAVHAGAEVYDGFFVHSRGGGAATLEGAPALWQAPCRIRDDLDVPVFIFETETDVGPMLRFAGARQPDTDRVRTWEVAGTAHADAYLIGDFKICDNVNDGPHHYVAKAAFASLLDWVTAGKPPPRSEPIRTDAPDGVVVLRDELGLALGGVRTPSVDVPVSVLSGDPHPGATLMCALFGSSTPFAAEQLASLYGTGDRYRALFDTALERAIAGGFVRPQDTDEYAATARPPSAPF